MLVLLVGAVAAEFRVTREWQEVPEGQHLPPGVHVRVNLQTGRKEVKWSEEGNRGSEVVARDEVDKAQGYNLSEKEWEEVLTALGMKVEDPFDVFNRSLQNLFEREYRSREELEQVLEDVDQAIRDVDISKAFVDGNSVLRFMELLTEFDGDSDILAHLYSSFGSAAQNNQYTACALKDAGVFVNCLNRVDESIRASPLHKRLPSRALYCVSSIARSCPSAQLDYLKSKQLDTLSVVLRSNDKSFVKLQRQAVDFIRTIAEDFILNRSETFDDSFFHYETELLSNSWCKEMMEVALKANDLDIIENSLSFLSSTKSSEYCRKVWDDDSRQALFEHANEIIQAAILESAMDESEAIADPYFSELLRLSQNFK